MEKKFKEIEVLKGFSILGVAVLHTTKDYVFTQNENILIFFAAVSAIVLFGVPSFIFISGFLLYSKFDNNYPLRKFYKKRFKKIIPPFIIFSVIYTIIHEIQNANINVNVLEKFSFIFIKIFTATASYHLWYFGLIFQFYLLYPFLSRLMRKYSNHILVLLITSFLIQIIWIIVSRLFIFKFIKTFEDLGIIYILINVPLQYLFLSHIAYFILGIYISEKYEKIKQIFRNKKFYLFIIPPLILSILVESFFWILGILEYNYLFNMPANYLLILNFFGLFLYSITTVFLLKLSFDLIKHDNMIKKVLTKFGQYSFGIYLIHAAIIMVIISLLNFININYNYWFYYLICIIFTVFISLIATYLISLLPYHEIFIGKIRYWSKKNPLDLVFVFLRVKYFQRILGKKKANAKKSRKKKI